MINADLLRELRISKRITQLELANALNTQPSTVNRLESGKNTNPKFLLVCKMADYFNLSVNELRK